MALYGWFYSSFTALSCFITIYAYGLSHTPTVLQVSSIICLLNEPTEISYMDTGSPLQNQGRAHNPQAILRGSTFKEH